MKEKRLEYKKFLKSINLRESTIKNYIWHIDKFFDWLKEEPFTEPSFNKYKDYLIKNYQKVATINLRLVILNNFFRFLGKGFKFDLLSDETSVAKVLAPEELNKFLEMPSLSKRAVALRDRALLEVLYSTGLKAGQIIKLKLEHIDDIKKEFIFDKAHIKIKATAWYHLQKYLTDRQDNDPWLFINMDRANKKEEKNLTVRSVERIVAKYGHKMRPVLTINPQILRNTLAYNLKQQGAGYDNIKKALHFKTKIGAENYFKRI
ncbi:tyrosine-type recombinase/integrase [Candidatus Parcubacteria bacterium]|jgi:site-specific recombinase XerD|nr:tyrosine-type recombinase/integrase [Candidatus Parcubacteria bacterium]MBT7228033.1 tyrosine-type recombinase/integrase [Candidatus Parcubacteria bacterium]